MSRRRRVLLIEDDVRRIERFRSWLPPTIILVEGRSAGQAMGFLKRLLPGELDGILLDHDLDRQAMTDVDIRLSGSDLIDLIVRHVERHVPIFIHSTNANGASSMAKRLKGAGFWVDQIPMFALTENGLAGWLDEVQSID